MRQELAKRLTAGALAHGFATELWTLARIARVIEQHFGIKYSAAQVWRILGALGWSCQRPTGRARERDEAAIRQWQQKRWPALKKTPQIRIASSSSSTSPD
jgi:transposase